MNIELRDRRRGVQWLCPLAPASLGGGWYPHRVAVPAHAVGGSVEGGLFVGTREARTPQHHLCITDAVALATAPPLTLFFVRDLTILAPSPLPDVLIAPLIGLVAGLVTAGAAVWLELDDDVFSSAWQVPWEEKIQGRLTSDRRAKRLEIHRRAETAWRQLASVARGVIASTPALAEVTRRYNPRVVVLPTMLHAPSLGAPRQRPPGQIAIGYAGGHAHFPDDLALALPGLLECARRPEVSLHFWGVHPRVHEQRPAHRQQPGRFTYAGVLYTFHGYLPDFATYHEEIGLLDIAVAPQVDVAPNRARSACKWLEHAFHGTAMVLSDSPPYAPVKHGHTGFKAKTAAEFTHHLRRLVDDADLRQRIGTAAQAEVLRTHTTEALGPVWRAFVASQGALPDVAAAARQHGTDPNIAGGAVWREHM